MPRGESQPASPGRRRGPLLVGVGAAAIIGSMAVGWILAGQFTSSQQRESAAEPPPPSPITVEVVEGDLTDSVSVSARFVREFTDDLIVKMSGEITVVTAQPASVGESVGAGEVVLEVSGRPVFLMPGAFPFYRDLVVGDSGPDVSQLQSGLAAAGHPVTVDGRFGPETVGAVTALYRAAGYSLPKGETPAPSTTPQPSEPAVTEATLTVPAQEFAVTPSVPAVVASATAIGVAPTEGAQIQLSSGALVASANVPEGVRARFALDSAGEAILADGAVDVTVSSIGSPDEETGESVVIFTPSSSVDDALAGSETAIRLDLEVAATDSLIVPTRSVIPRGERDQVVSVLTVDGTFELIEVREIAQLSGLSAVSAVVPGSLTAGDRVRVDQ